MKKTIALIALLSLSTFSAMADESGVMTQEQARAREQYQTQNAYQMHVKEANTGTESQIKNQMQNRVQMQMQPQMNTQMQSHTQNRMQQSNARGGRN